MTNEKHTLPDSRERDCIQSELDVNLLVEAAAGTGKTTSLIARTINLIREGKCTVETLAAVTFTRKAAAEMRSRFQLELERSIQTSSGAVRSRLSNALERIDNCFIGTIHSFCGRILRERPVEAGVDIAFREIDDFEDRLIRREAWDEYASHLYANDDPILDELREAGVEIGVLFNTFSLLADYPDVDEWPHPKITMPDLQPIRKLLLEYVSHMERLNPTLPDDPGNDSLIAQYKNIPRVVKYRDLSKPDSFMKVVDEFKRCKVVQKKWPEGKDQALGELQRWDAFRDAHVSPLQEKWLAFRYEICMRAVLPVMHRYDGIKKRKGVLNFQDLLLYAARMFKRWPQVRRYFQNRITHLLVDEFQDTDPIQAEIMMLLTSGDLTVSDWRKCIPRPGSLFVVGDPKQSIYRFRRADIVTYNQVKSIVRENGGKILHLSSNFRTDARILEWVNHTFEKQFPETETPYSPVYVPLQHGKSDSTIQNECIVQKILIPAEYNKNEDCVEYESEFIAKWIFDEIQSDRAKPGDFMIVAYLTRNMNVYAKKLERYQIPCRVTGGDALNQVEELRLLLLCLNAVAQSWNPVALVALLRSELFGYSDPELYAFKKKGGAFAYLDNIPDGLPQEIQEQFRDVYERLRMYRRWIKKLPYSAAIEKICTSLGLFAHASAFPGADGRCGCLAKAIDLVRSTHDQFNSFSDVLVFFNQIVENEIKLDGATAAPPPPSVVRIMNLHKVKGLEAPIVFLADPTGKYKHAASLHIDRSGSRTKAYLTMEEMNQWSRQRKTVSQHDGWPRFCGEEQRYLDAEKVRLLYVAATRCGQRLIVSQRERGDRFNPWDFFSPFLSDKPPLAPPSIEAFAGIAPQQVTQSDLEESMVTMRRRYQRITDSTYLIAAVRETVQSIDGDFITRDEGVQWGIFLHAVLENLVRHPEIQMERTIEKIINTNGLHSSWRKKAEKNIASILNSDIWRRSLVAEKRMAEVPIRHRRDRNPSMVKPTLLRGVIDLIFKETDGWVLVDYKTDVAARMDENALVEKYRPQILAYIHAWERIAGENVKEAGLYFTETHRFVWVTD